MTAPVRHAIGCMTGTSLDGLDCAVAVIEGRGLEMSAHVIRCASEPLGALAPRLRALAEGAPHSAGEIAKLALDFGDFHAQTLQRVVSEPPDIVALHGQTVFHAPPVSWQMINPWPVARALACPVVYDLRAADLTAGGQGAPITPLADWILFRDRAEREPRVVVNLGGFCNVTLLPAGAGPEGVRGRDVCACNQVLDAVARRALGSAYDENGAAASRGRPDERAAGELSAALGAQSASGRSLGSGDELMAWIEAHATRIAPADLAASAAAAIGAIIGKAVAGQGRVVLAGGGVHNRALVGAIERACPAPVAMTDQFGVPAGHREAACMAVLGALSADGVSITLPGATGVPAPAPIAGAWINRPMTQP